jgi:hypothetical protein
MWHAELTFASEPEPVDLGVAVKSGAKSLWRNVRSTISSSSSSSSQTASSPSRSSLSSQSDLALAGSPSSAVSASQPLPLSPHPQRASAQTSSVPDSLPPPAPSGEYAQSISATGLQAVTEETNSGAATPLASRNGGSLGLENLHVRLEGVGPHTPRLTSTNLARVPSADRYRDWSASLATPDDKDGPEPTLKHPDATRQQPSPPPRLSDRRGPGEEIEAEEGEADDQEVPGRSASAATVRPGSKLLRSASHGANDYVERWDRVITADAEREERGETKASAISGYQRGS